MWKRRHLSAVLLGAVVGCAIGVSLLLCLLWPCITRCVEYSKAQDVAIARDSYTAMEAAISYAKRMRRVPASVADCVSVDLEASRQWNRRSNAHLRGYPFLVVEWPPARRSTVLHTVFDRIVLNFPENPDSLMVQDGVLVSRETMTAAPLLSVQGIEVNDYPGLRNINVQLWNAWRAIVDGRPTGIDWLDNYHPRSRTTSSNASNAPH